jgi:hypothetical protein
MVFSLAVLDVIRSHESTILTYDVCFSPVIDGSADVDRNREDGYVQGARAV